MDLQKMTMVEIQKFAKSIGLKGYSKFTKKADLITFVEPFVTTEEPKTENPISTQEFSLTELEEQLLQDIIGDNFFSPIEPTNPIWTDHFLENSTLIDSKKARGVLSSLSKKGLIEVGTEAFNLTQAGVDYNYTLEEEDTFGPSETEAFYQSEVSIKDIAFDFKTTDRKVRRILRTNGFTKHPELGWNFERDSQEHKAVLTLLNEKLGGGQ